MSERVMIKLMHDRAVAFENNCPRCCEFGRCECSRCPDCKQNGLLWCVCRVAVKPFRALPLTAKVLFGRKLIFAQEMFENE